MKISSIIAVIIGAPLAILSKFASEIFLVLFALIYFKADPQKLADFVSKSSGLAILNLPIILINIFAMPMLIGYIIAKISKNHAMVCAFIVGIFSLIVGLYFGYTANAIIQSILKNSISFSMIMIGAFIYKEIEIDKNL